MTLKYAHAFKGNKHLDLSYLNNSAKFLGNN